MNEQLQIEFRLLCPKCGKPLRHIIGLEVYIPQAPRVETCECGWSGEVEFSLGAKGDTHRSTVLIFVVRDKPGAVAAIPPWNDNCASLVSEECQKCLAGDDKREIERLKLDVDLLKSGERDVDAILAANNDLQRKVKSLRAEVIEECARIVEGHIKPYTGREGYLPAVAAAIREHGRSK